MSLKEYKESDIYTHDNSQSKIMQDYSELTIRHLTIKQIQKSVAHPNKLLMIDNEPVYRLILTAKIIDIKRKSNYLLLTLDDYTSIKNYSKIIANQTEQSIMSDIKLSNFVVKCILYSTRTNTTQCR